ncbi:MAG TPA: bifunctional diaminohydroxyphosphoribosylaminopyrimidine deaminase/5-amino-6-(5-phosphoribosylamino)uracil reductase RibD [Acidiferrobacterales bacterium]|nr:bifunctional diaminohydroxyphosphoribosylaminopyrimidine deaminase/5-amino-6-(5-phosphoribosylamino)uracil reductase RibD [Acidiferrobacterales bacterium]
MAQFAEDQPHMARALALAQRGLYTTDPNPRVGCVIVKHGAIVGEGWHVRAGEAHAEIHALRAAGDNARGATAYVTLEPCCHYARTPPCTRALINAGVARVVSAMQDPNPQVAGKGAAALMQANIEVKTGLMQTEAEALNPGFISRMRRGRPYVRAKIAASLDGRTATARGESKWITGAAARADVHAWRARSSAVVTGIGTVLADDPALTVRVIPTERQPLRVVVDSRLRLPKAAKLLAAPGALVVAADPNPDATLTLRQAGAEIICLPQAGGQVDLPALMQYLAAREVNEVLLEAGPTLCGAMLLAGLIDQLVLYFAPCLLGDRARGMFHIPGLERLADRVGLKITEVQAVGADWRIIAEVAALSPDAAA